MREIRNYIKSQPQLDEATREKLGSELTAFIKTFTLTDKGPDQVAIFTFAVTLAHASGKLAYAFGTNFLDSPAAKDFDADTQRDVIDYIRHCCVRSHEDGAREAARNDFERILNGITKGEI